MNIRLPFERLEIPRATWQIGKRPYTTHITVHYNGPKVPGAGVPKLERAQLIADARYHMRPGALGARSGGDGIQYHGATLSDGTNVVMRELDAMLWHCANYEGNRCSLSWHIPIGEGQYPTLEQLYSFRKALDILRAIYNIPVVNVKGHREWSSTRCPGNMMPYVVGYRAGKEFVTGSVEWYVTIANANVRTAPDVDSPIALDGTAVTPNGTVFAVDAIVEGISYKGDPKYVHRADGLGFYHDSVVAPLKGSRV